MIYYKVRVRSHDILQGQGQVTRYTTRSGSGHMIYYKVRVRSHDTRSGSGHMSLLGFSEVILNF